jgi:4-amino-4-deoxy-L-arabinose transferase-like glycosyltransferase
VAVNANIAAGRLHGLPRSARWLARPVVILCALALVVRVVVVLATPHFHPVTDSAEYDRNAIALVDSGSFGISDATFHGGPTAYHPPLFSIALAGVYELSGASNASRRWEAGRLFEAAMGALAVGLVFELALMLFGPLVAIAAGGLAAVYPPLVLVGSSLMSESVFLPLALGAVLAALKARQDPKGWKWQVAAGALGGLAALTRESGVVLLAGLCWLAWSGRPWRSWGALRAPAMVLAVAILVLTPWAIRNASTFGQFEPLTTGTGYALAGAYDHESQTSRRFPAMWQAPFSDIAATLRQNPHANEAQISSALITMSLHYVEHHPGSLVKTAYWSTKRLLNLTGPGFEKWFARYEGYPDWLAVLSVYSFWLVASLALGALAWPAARRIARRAPVAFWACPALMFLASVPFAGSTRYRSPADPFVVLLAAALIAAAWERSRHGREARAA